MPDSRLRILQYGLGPIGLATARAVLDRSARFTIAGAVDIDPDKAGRDLGELLGLDRSLGVAVRPDAAEALAETRPDVVLHTTSSFLDRVSDQIVACASAGAHVVSSTEELAYPYLRSPEAARAIDRAAREHGVAVLGTGVNPGFAMDTLALTATAPCLDVSRVDVERVVDAAGRRAPLQRKVGAGLTVERFEERRATGTFGHIGLAESLFLLADGLGWKLDRHEETLEPVVAERPARTPYVEVQPGEVAGIHHRIEGIREGRIVLELDLKMYVGAPAPRDRVRVHGDPPIDLVVHGGIFGDTATVAALVNAVPLVAAASPGLHTVLDLPVPRFSDARPD